MDSKTLNRIRTAFDQGMKHNRELRDKRDQKLWKNVSEPYRLESLLHSLSKIELDDIRKSLDLKGISNLKKADLIQELVVAIPSHLRGILSTFDQERYGLFKKIVSHSGKIQVPRNVSIEHIKSLMGWGIIFPICLDGKQGLTVPIELVEQFSAVDDQELHKIIDRNTEWIRLTQGLLYYYGVVHTSVLVDMVSELLKQEIDFKEFSDVLNSASDYYQQMGYSLYGFVDKRVYNVEKTFEEIEKRLSIGYYPFTKQQLLKAGKPGYVEKTREMKSLIQFLQQYYHLTAEDIEDLNEQLNTMILNDASLNQVVEYFQLQFEFRDFEFINDLTYHLTELMNHSRRWMLKGHTPKEISQRRKPVIGLSSAQNPQPSTNVIDFKSRKAIGRNDPCPCGSGKKYKKCCLNNLS